MRMHPPVPPVHSRRHTRFITLVFAATAALTCTFAGCKSGSSMPPNPSTIINNTHNQLTPFRFTFATDPAVPNYHAPILLKVHVSDATNQPADDVSIQAAVSMKGMENDTKHLTLSGKGQGDYEGGVNLDMAGSWDVDLTATKEGKGHQQKLSIEVGG